MAKKSNDKIKKYILGAIIIISIIIAIFIFRSVTRQKKDPVNKNLCSPDNLRGICDKGNYCNTNGQCTLCPKEPELLTNTQFMIEVCKTKDGKPVCLGPQDDGALYAKYDGTVVGLKEASKFFFSKIDKKQPFGVDTKTKEKILAEGDNKYVLTTRNPTKNNALSFAGSSCKSAQKEGITGDNCPITCSYNCNKGVGTLFNDVKPSDTSQLTGVYACTDKGEKCSNGVSQHVMFSDFDKKIQLKTPAYNTNTVLVQPDCGTCALHTLLFNTNHANGCVASGIGCPILFKIDDKTVSEFVRFIKPACLSDGDCNQSEVCSNGICKFIGC
jgi:hypothetical protein